MYMDVCIHIQTRVCEYSSTWKYERSTMWQGISYSPFPTADSTGDTARTLTRERVMGEQGQGAGYII